MRKELITYIDAILDDDTKKIGIAIVRRREIVETMLRNIENKCFACIEMMSKEWFDFGTFM